MSALSFQCVQPQAAMTRANRIGQRFALPTRCHTVFRPCSARSVSRPAIRSPVCNYVPTTTAKVSVVDKRDAFWSDTTRSLLKSVAVCGVALALALGSVSPAEAARSGGRAGGSSFSSRSSMSRSYSSPSRSSGSIGGGRSYTSSVSSYAAPSVTFMPSFFMPVSPFGMGYGYSSGSSLFTLLFLAMAAFAAITAFNSFSSTSSSSDTLYDESVTVAKVQVGLLGLAQALKHDLDSLAVKADTSDARGLHMLLQETVLALLRNPDYYVYGASAAEQLRDGDAAERAFSRLSLAERGKFREETLSNVGGVTRRRTFNQKDDGVNELMVVTIVVAAEGRLNLPPIRNSQDVRACLNSLGGIAPSKVVAVELLWTPQADGDFYTRDEVISDYPDMAPL